MAFYSTGISVTWGGSAFSEVVDLQWQAGGGPPKGRNEVWSDEVGSCSVTCLGNANASSSEYGLRKQLQISGGGQSLTAYAIWESVSVENEVNGVARFTVTFKLLDG